MSLIRLIRPPSGRADAPARQRGAASLVVVLMLFFVIALVSAYTSRNLIFEQRTSVNQYRSSMAFETAEAGLEWAVALLNGGRIGNNCAEAGAPAGSPSFRQRYLSIDHGTGIVTPRMQAGNPLLSLKPTCVWNGTTWVCNCPVDGEPVLALPAGGGLQPAFRLRFVPLLTRPGVVRIQVNGCVRMTEECLDDFTDTPRDSEGRAQHSALLALKSAVTTVPAAALTVYGDVAGGAGGTVANTDMVAGAITVHAAGVVNLGGLTLVGAPGTPPSLSFVANDTSLIPNGLVLGSITALPAVPDNRDRVFGSVFGLTPATYREQPAMRVLDLSCRATSSCREQLSDLVASNPDRVIWVPGDLELDSLGDVGSLPNPGNAAAAGMATIVVDGNVRFMASGVNIYGVVYARSGAWSGNAAASITGAALVEGSLTLAPGTSPTVTYNQAVINAARRSSGSFVVLPGDWKDFRDSRI